MRRFSWSTHYEYTTNGDNRLETREYEFGPFLTDFQSSDGIGIKFTRTYEFIQRPFSIAEGVTVPAGTYEFFNVRNVYTFGQQRRVSGAIQLERGSFYGGDKTTVVFRSGRMEIMPQLALEPGVTFNWIELPTGKFTIRLLSTRAIYTVTPRMSMAALVQYNSSNTAFTTNIRLRWEYRPGGELFVVYTEGRNTFPRGATELTNRALVVKINRLFRF